MSIKTILGYDIVPGVTPEEYETWLFEVHPRTSWPTPTWTGSSSTRSCVP